jgi:tetratricopeptide (TPR) repeat protein
MASLSLRAYLQKIENLIDRGETEQSIAHCKHILKKFPKHVDTYRLLGKSYLEMQRFQEASDVLQRVLSVIPDDFVSQIGMSIIRESAENLDEAIWHMERAFEIQPSNNAVQDELKRLYGRRDGVIPQKILLTRGALVRMYVRGEAYPQAIAEGIAALKEEPQRPDIQLLLAKSYLRTNQINEGYRICQNILESLPYSYEANQLIAEIHILTKQSDQAEPYLERVRMLDPYAAFVNENAPTSAKVDENAIIIDELDYDEFAGSFDQSSSSESSLFIEDDFDTSSLEIPAAEEGSQPIEIEEDFSWMHEMMEGNSTEKSSTNQSMPKESASIFDSTDEEIDFSWDTASDEAKSISSESTLEDKPTDFFPEETDSSVDDEAFAALFNEIKTNNETSPDQLAGQVVEEPQRMSMEEFLSHSTQQEIEEESSSDEDDAKFAALFDEKPAQAVVDNKEVESSLPDVQDGTTDDLPDWLKELDQETQQSDIEDDLQNEIDSLFTNGNLTSGSDDSDNLTSMETGLEDEDEFAAKFLQELEEEPQHPGKTRMFSMTADLSGGDSGPLPPLNENITPADKTSTDETPDWLKQLEDQTNEFSAVNEASEISSEDIDFAMTTDRFESETEVANSTSIDSMSSEEEDRLREQFRHTEDTSKSTQILPEEDDSFAWLESLAAKQSGTIENEIIEEDESSVEISPTEPAISKPASTIDMMSEEEEEKLREQFLNTQQTSNATQTLSEEEDDSFAWLESLAAKQGASEDTLFGTDANLSSEENVDEQILPTSQPKSSSSIDAMTEEEEERLREQFKKSQETSKATQMLSDDDDSFAWLESLAAKQGADEDTLFSSEQERPVEAPQWLEDSDEFLDFESVPVMPEHTAILNNLDEYNQQLEEEPVTISKLEQSESSIEMEPEMKIEEPIWVDEFDTEKSDLHKEKEILPLDSEENGFFGEPEKESEIADEAEIISTIADVENIPDSIEESQPHPISEPPQTPEEIPDWLKDLEEQTSIYAMTDEDQAGYGILDIEDVDIPGWITDVNETQVVQTDDEEGESIPEVHSEFLYELAEEEGEDSEAVAKVGLDISELERKLEEEQIIDHVDAVSSLRDLEITHDTIIHPDVISETLKQSSEETAEAETFDIPSDFVNEILQITEPSGPTTEMDDEGHLLTDMSNLLANNRISDALEIADQLIEKEIYLNTIIDELTKAIVDHPLDPAVFIRLGDAYIRNNEIQKALDMYQEAETLLQK